MLFDTGNDILISDLMPYNNADGDYMFLKLHAYLRRSAAKDKAYILILVPLFFTIVLTFYICYWPVILRAMFLRFGDIYIWMVAFSILVFVFTGTISLYFLYELIRRIINPGNMK